VISASLMPRFFQPIGQQTGLDVLIAVAVVPIAQITIAQLVLKKGNNPILCGAFALAYLTHSNLLFS
jgi:hypothetical protein